MSCNLSLTNSRASFDRVILRAWQAGRLDLPRMTSIARHIHDIHSSLKLSLDATRHRKSNLRLMVFQGCQQFAHFKVSQPGGCLRQ